MGAVKPDAEELRALFDALEVGICLLDAGGWVRFANRALSARFPCDPAGLVDRPLAKALPFLAEEVDWSQAARSAVERGRSLRLARHPIDGGAHVDCRLVPVTLCDGLQGRYALLTLEDVSEAVGLEERLLRQARTQALANLGDSVAHEVRNPLNSIHMNIQLMREQIAKGEIDPEKIEHTAAIVQREIKRLDRIVRDFVQYSRPPALCLEPASINHVVRTALDLLDGQIQAQGIAVEADLQSARPVRMDRDRIQRAIYNVLLNAVQALAPQGGSIICRSRDEERRCVLEVSDDGPGIDPGHSAHIFEIFHTTKAGGSGLGLPIANRIIEEHGGRMAVASSAGQGTTFAFFLPYEGPPPGSEAGPTTIARKAEGSLRT